MTNAPIVVGVDGSPSSSDAVRWATREAEIRHAPLLLLSCISYRGAEAAVPCIGTELRARAERDLAAAVGIAQTQNHEGEVDIRTEVHAQYAPAALVDCSDSAGMIVVGRRGLGEFTGGLLGSVSSIVARHARCPVAVIEGWSRVEDGSGPVVVGADGSAASSAAIDVAFEECALRGAELVALHAWSDQNLSQIHIDPHQWEAAEQSERVLLAECLAGRTERYPDVVVRVVVVRDRPVRHLLAEAEQAQLIVVGSHGRGGFAGMTLGSTSEALLHITTCPLLIVRPRSED